jgi:hypothetical protein
MPTLKSLSKEELSASRGGDAKNQNATNQNATKRWLFCFLGLANMYFENSYGF